MPNTCCVPNCTNRSGGHKFPKDECMLKLWVVAIKRDKWQPNRHSTVCFNHFAAEDYIQENIGGKYGILILIVVAILTSDNNVFLGKFQFSRSNLTIIF